MTIPALSEEAKRFLHNNASESWWQVHLQATKEEALKTGRPVCLTLQINGKREAIGGFVPN